MPAAPAPGFTDVTVNEMLLALLRHDDAHYRRPEGTATNEVAQYKQTLRLVRELYPAPARQVPRVVPRLQRRA